MAKAKVPRYRGVENTEKSNYIPVSRYQTRLRQAELSQTKPSQAESYHPKPHPGKPCHLTHVIIASHATSSHPRISDNTNHYYSRDKMPLPPAFPPTLRPALPPPLTLIACLSAAVLEQHVCPRSLRNPARLPPCPMLLAMAATSTPSDIAPPVLFKKFIPPLAVLSENRGSSASASTPSNELREGTTPPASAAAAAVPPPASPPPPPPPAAPLPADSALPAPRAPPASVPSWKPISKPPRYSW